MPPTYPLAIWIWPCGERAGPGRAADHGGGAVVMPRATTYAEWLGRQILEDGEGR